MRGVDPYILYKGRPVKEDKFNLIFLCYSEMSAHGPFAWQN